MFDRRKWRKPKGLSAAPQRTQFPIRTQQNPSSNGWLVPASRLQCNRVILSRPRFMSDLMDGLNNHAFFTGFATCKSHPASKLLTSPLGALGESTR